MLNLKKKIHFYIFIFFVLFLVSIVGNKFKKNIANNNDEYTLIKKYLLNESPLYKDNKPKLWIHTKYEYNSRIWKSFFSRSSFDLNQPYIHLCIRSIIHHCGNDFNIILIDDNAFQKLIPSWDIDFQFVAEPLKSHLRELGLAELLYFYGGMIVPSTFICNKNMNSLHSQYISQNKPYVSEKINRTTNQQKPKTAFLPNSFFMGALKDDLCIRDYIEFLKKQNRNPHVSSESDFLGDNSQFFVSKINNQEINLIGGESIGTKDVHGKPILIEQLFEDDFLDLNFHQNYGMFVDEEMLLKRNKYNWFCIMSTEEILKQPIYISKCLVNSLLELPNSEKNIQRSLFI